LASEVAEGLLLKGGTGIAEKSGETYRFLKEAVVRSLQKDSNGLEASGGARLSSAELLREFQQHCGDGDFADRVEWRKVGDGKSSRIEAAFTCAPDSEHPELGHKSFAFTLDRGDGGFIARPEAMVAIQKEPEDDRGRKIRKALVAGARSVGTVAASVYLANKWTEHAMAGQGHDKLTHARMSAFLSSSLAAAAYYFFDLSPEKAALVGGSIGWGLGMAREVNQGILKGDPTNTNGTWSDIRANNLGVLVGSALMYVNLKFQ
jgi:hypothetical protein